ncbi:MAG TPA: FxSxx-COOH system tetratricopeptide repeat protein [Candidatus Elarobacter sp.]|jgi:tetratricopeptide (TPR) repeat protein|nr:FxSxx-COOH system tetratricopeptide repeat protein [Candidatus Elarobacter sp.]
MNAEKTLFISHAYADRDLAERVARTYERDGYHAILQKWDFPNSNFINEMHEALMSDARVVSLLSPAYLKSDYCEAEWTAVLAGDPLNRNRRLIVLRIAACGNTGVLAPISYWDLLAIQNDDVLLSETLRLAVKASHRPAITQGQALYCRPAAVYDPELTRETPNFTGRAAELDAIAAAFAQGSGTVAITGLAGIGKSALAAEYARLGIGRYAAAWRVTAESESEIVDGLIRLGAAFIQGLERERDRTAAAQRVVAALGARFATPVLLIFDNAEDEWLVRRWRPRGGTHMLVTTRLTGWASDVTAVPLRAMSADDALGYLRRESGRVDLTDTGARNIVETLDCLPLALAHAAAYLKRTRNATAEHYLERIAHHLAIAPKGAQSDRAVFATFLEVIARAEQEAPGAAAVLCLASLFAPDAIPETLVDHRLGIPHALPSPVLPEAGTPIRGLGETLDDGANALEEALGALHLFSLITFEGTRRTFSMHRLVQAAGRDVLADMVVPWAQCALSAAYSAFPTIVPANWDRCERLLPHALSALEIVPNERMTRIGLHLLRRCAQYLERRAAFRESEPLYRRALEISEAHDDDEEHALDLNNLGNLLVETNRPAEAEPLLKEALDLVTKTNGDHDRNVAMVLNNLAGLLCDVGRIAEAEPLYRQALAIHDASEEPNAPILAKCLNNLAELLRKTNRPDEAEDLFRRAIAIVEVNSYDEDDPNFVIPLSNFAGLLRDTDRLDEAEPLYHRALAIAEASYGPDHPTVAVVLRQFGALLRSTHRLSRAEPLVRRALSITEARFGPNHPDVAACLDDLAWLLHDMERVDEAEPLYRRALKVAEENLAPNHLMISEILNNLAELLRETSRPGEAELLYRRALEIAEPKYAMDPHNVAAIVDNLTILLRHTDRPAEAEELSRRLLAIDEAHHGSRNRAVAAHLYGFAELLRETDRLLEAEPFYRRALAIEEARCGPDDPKVKFVRSYLEWLFRPK